MLVPVTVPTPWSMLIVVAPVTTQLNDALWPEVIHIGEAENDVITGAVGPVVVTVTFV